LKRRKKQAEAQFEFYENNFYRKGFCYREVTTSTMLKKESTTPSLDELQRFVTADGAAENDEDEDDDGGRRRSVIVLLKDEIHL